MKKLIAMLVCFSITVSLFVPAFAMNVREPLATDLVSQPSSQEEISTTPSELTPPPELIIGEGEEWIPDAIDPLLISPHSDEDECGHYTGPSNYRFIGAVRGSTEADVQAVDTFTSVVTAYVPQLNIVFHIISALSSIFPGDKLEGDYVKYQYIYNVGPDPNMYWFHTFFACATLNGEPIGSACYATYSPPKPGDRYQD